MMSTIRIVVVALFASNNVYALDNMYRNCRERNRLVENEKGDLYALIDATPDQKLTLQCHYCDETDDGTPKIWYKIDDVGESGPHEVLLDMNNNVTTNRIHVNVEHSLIVHNFTQNDTGLYYCERFEGEQQEKHNYLVDLIYEENVTILETGNLTDWKKYHEEQFAPINMLFAQSNGVEFVRIRKELMIEMEVVTAWGPWGFCVVCGRPNDEGIRKKIGYCRIKLTQKGSLKSADPDVRFLKNANKIGCRSQVLGRLLPGVSNSTRIIPNFVQIQSCEGTCNPDAEGLSKGWKTGKTAAYKFRKTFVIPELSHLTLVCPESTLDNKVVWKRNGKILKAGKMVEPPEPDAEPRIMVDTFNTLYLVDVKKSEAGNYTCQVDDIQMQQVVVFVVSKSRLLTQVFVRHLMYLGLILSLTVPCYFAGIIITCNRKHTFKGYQELKEDDLAKRPYARYLNSP